MKPGLHNNHRERMRERFRRNGTDGFQEHELLEMLLYFVIPRRNTNDIAHELLDRFGSISGVLSADERSLAKVSGIGETVSGKIRFLGEFYDRISAELFRDFLIDSDEINSHWWIYAIPDDAVAVHLVDHNPLPKSDTEPKQAHKESDNVKAAKEFRQPFNWYVKPSDPNAMASIIGRLPTYLLKMPSNTQICIQAGNHTATIQSVVYEPEKSRLIFRAFESEFNEELTSK